MKNSKEIYKSQALLTYLRRQKMIAEWKESRTYLSKLRRGMRDAIRRQTAAADWICFWIAATALVMMEVCR